jgi:hypothetical protein
VGLAILLFRLAQGDWVASRIEIMSRVLDKVACNRPCWVPAVAGCEGAAQAAAGCAFSILNSFGGLDPGTKKPGSLPRFSFLVGFLCRFGSELR